MWPFSQSKNEAQAVVDYVSPSVFQTVRPWLKMLEMYRGMGRKAEFEVVAYRLHDDFNLKLISWFDAEGDSGDNTDRLENYSAILNRIIATWGQRECLVFVNGLLEGNGEACRGDFSLGVFEELLLLAEVLENLGRPACHTDAVCKPAESRKQAGAPSGLLDLIRSVLAVGAHSAGSINA